MKGLLLTGAIMLVIASFQSRSLKKSLSIAVLLLVTCILFNHIDIPLETIMQEGVPVVETEDHTAIIEILADASDITFHNISDWELTDAKGNLYHRGSVLKKGQYFLKGKISDEAAFTTYISASFISRFAQMLMAALFICASMVLLYAEKLSPEKMFLAIAVPFSLMYLLLFPPGGCQTHRHIL